MRRRLVTYFDRRNRPSADALADEALNRIGKTLENPAPLRPPPPVTVTWSPDSFCSRISADGGRQFDEASGKRSRVGRTPMRTGGIRPGATPRGLDRLRTLKPTSRNWPTTSVVSRNDCKSTSVTTWPTGWASGLMHLVSGHAASGARSRRASAPAVRPAERFGRLDSYESEPPFKVNMSVSRESIEDDRQLIRYLCSLLSDEEASVTSASSRTTSRPSEERRERSRGRKITELEENGGAVRVVLPHRRRREK
jgi:hypothetical protein